MQKLQQQKLLPKARKLYKASRFAEALQIFLEVPASEKWTAFDLCFALQCAIHETKTDLAMNYANLLLKRVNIPVEALSTLAMYAFLFEHLPNSKQVEDFLLTEYGTPHQMQYIAQSYEKLIEDGFDANNPLMSKNLHLETDKWHWRIVRTKAKTAADLGSKAVSHLALGDEEGAIEFALQSVIRGKKGSNYLEGPAYVFNVTGDFYRAASTYEMAADGNNNRSAAEWCYYQAILSWRNYGDVVRSSEILRDCLIRYPKCALFKDLLEEQSKMGQVIDFCKKKAEKDAEES